MACPRCEMPDVDVEVATVLNLRTWCKTYRVLPYPGTPLEQPALVMDLFTIIDEAYVTEQKRRESALENEMRGAQQKTGH